MNFIESMEMFGVDAKEIPCMRGAGAPNETTAGAVGSLYMNTDNGELFKCTAVVGGVYTWRAIGGTVSWNDLTDKPFSDGSVWCEFDAQKEYTADVGIWVKLRDDAPQPEFFLGKSFYAELEMSVGEVTVFNEKIDQSIIYQPTDGVYSIGEICLVVTTDSFENGDAVLSRGVWTAAQPGLIKFAILDEPKQLDEKYIPALSWFSLKDRPFYRDVTYSYNNAYLDKTVKFTDENGVYISEQVSIGVNLIEGGMFHVLWDGKEYYTPVRLHNGVAYIGNLSIVEADAPDTSEPFYMYDAEYRKDVIFKTLDKSSSHDITARTATEETVSVKKIHEEMIPDTIARISDVQQMIAAALADIMQS